MYSMVEPQHQPNPNRSWSQRIINSATGLTREFFQGPSSSFDIPQLSAVKGSSQRSTQSHTAARDVSLRQHAGGVLACDFRRLRDAEEEKEREDTFRRFAESGVGSWRDMEGEGVCGGYAEMQARGEELERTESNSQIEESRGGMEMGMYEGMHPSARIFPPPAAMTSWAAESRSETTETKGKDLWRNLDEVESIWNRSKSAAVERLRQVQDHLDMEKKPATTTKHILQPIQPLPEDLESFQALLNTIRHGHAQPERADENIDVTYFHCPHMECHRRLEKQNESLPASFPMRACVHTGCGFVGRSVEEWVVHCVVGEHHLGREGKRGGEKGCECRSLEDTHV